MANLRKSYGIIRQQELTIAEAEMRAEEEVVLMEGVVTREMVTETGVVIPEAEVLNVENEEVAVAIKAKLSMAEKDEDVEELATPEKKKPSASVAPSVEEVVEVREEKSLIGEVMITLMEEAPAGCEMKEIILASVKEAEAVPLQKEN